MGIINYQPTGINNFRNCILKKRKVESMSHDRPKSTKPAYFAGFGAFFFAFLTTCGLCGVFSKRRRTSSSRGRFGCFVGVFTFGTPEPLYGIDILSIRAYHLQRCS